MGHANLRDLGKTKRFSTKLEIPWLWK